MEVVHARCAPCALLAAMISWQCARLVVRMRFVRTEADGGLFASKGGGCSYLGQVVMGWFQVHEAVHVAKGPKHCWHHCFCACARNVSDMHAAR
jgi:hypothetical protein